MRIVIQTGIVVQLACQCRRHKATLVSVLVNVYGERHKPGALSHSLLPGLPYNNTLVLAWGLGQIHDSAPRKEKLVSWNIKYNLRNQNCL